MSRKPLAQQDPDLNKAVIKIVRESLQQASKIRVPHAPPYFYIADTEDYLEKCETLRKELVFIRGRASDALAKIYGDSGEYVRNLNSFFEPVSAIQQLDAERNNFTQLLTRILDELRLSVTSRRSTNPPLKQASKITITVTNGDVNIGGDVVGRDKTTNNK